MKKTNLFYTTLWITLGAGLMLSANSFAMIDEEPKWERCAMERQHRQINPIRNFINSDISDEEKEELKTAMQAHREEGKKLFEAFKEAKDTGEDTADLEEELKAHKIAMLDIFDDYIAEDKTDDWVEFKAEAAENWVQMKGRMKDRMKNMMKWGQKGPMMGIRNFIDPDLTDEEKEELKAVMQAHKEEMKTLFESIRDAKEAGKDTTDLEAQIQENMIDGLSILDDYIAEDKVDDWKEYKEKTARMIAEGPKNRVRPNSNMRRNHNNFQGQGRR